VEEDNAELPARVMLASEQVTVIVTVKEMQGPRTRNFWMFGLSIRGATWPASSPEMVKTNYTCTYHHLASDGPECKVHYLRDRKGWIGSREIRVGRMIVGCY
jgi:hypothetical protein